MRQGLLPRFASAWWSASLLIAPAFSQDLFLAALPKVDLRPQPQQPACPPLEWIKKDFGSGHWILNYTDRSWTAYMKFLGVDSSHWSQEFNTSDIHQYVFFDDTFIMNHTIPLTKFHLLFEAPLTRKWNKNKYPAVTPAGMDPKAAQNLTDWRNYFEEPGHPHPDSCWALRTDMAVAHKVCRWENFDCHWKSFVVTFWRELTSPIDMRVTLHVYDNSTQQVIEPWKSQMGDVKPFPAFSYRYFRKTVQSFGDAAARLPCAPTGLRDGTFFC